MDAAIAATSRRRIAATLGTATLLLTLCTVLGGGTGHGPDVRHRAADPVAATATPTPGSGSAQPNDEDWG
ncbi:hypothetical protein GXW83_21905 [Streptacidiphilus sp. PB12-B1b]|uniref:hypothetical protein n=1 Tax=Streptacidiphilus sp. PB12-B1b TaxID=2705012 RepID=UPI0015F98F99|nr:hypothetical protein [Streptacidiphilus sp. PB12-B1b]QMU77955.1 hypothetical protein GXW83_21905 [Streptacidiphilus sp. PB12-B1b]